MIPIIILSTLLILSLIVLLVRDLITAVIVMGVFSLLSCLLFFVLDAPDVALTEAAVGAGLSTFLYIWILSKTRERKS